MKAALTITYILFPTLIGFIIGGFVVDNGYIVGWSIALLLLDIFIGTFLKRRQEEAEEETWDNLSFEEKRAAVRDTLAGKV